MNQMMLVGIDFVSHTLEGLPGKEGIWLATAPPQQTIETKLYISHSSHHHQFKRPHSSKINQGMDGCFPTALGRQSTFSNFLGPLV